jgi:hypothetical protein
MEVRMKRFMLIFGILLAVVTSLSAQNDDAAIQDAETIPKLLVHTDKLFSPLSFKFLDGTPATSSELDRLLNVPENTILFRQIKPLVVTNRILRGLTLAAVAGVLVYVFADLPANDVMLPVLSGTMIATTVAGVYTGQAVGTKYLRAVDNYNLYIMGIPITKK